MGCTRDSTQMGVTMTGRRSVRYRSISNDALPLPMITPAWRTTLGTPESRKIWPTSAREERCAEMVSSSVGTRPPR